MTAEEMLRRLDELEGELAKHVGAWREVIESCEGEIETAPMADFAGKTARAMVESGERVLGGKKC
jgi:hypothetical protein